MDSLAEYKNTLLGITNSVPLPARPIYQTALIDFAKNVSKYFDIDIQIAQCKKLKSEGRTSSNFNSIKSPKIQLSASFLSRGPVELADDAGLEAELKDWQDSEGISRRLRNDLFNKFILIKEKEKEFYRKKYIEDSSIKTIAKAVLDEAAIACAASYGFSDISDVPKEVRKTFDDLGKNLQQPFRLTISVVEGKIAGVQRRKLEKQEAIQKAKQKIVEEKDIDKSISTAVKAALAREKQSRKDKQKHLSDKTQKQTLRQKGSTTWKISKSNVFQNGKGKQKKKSRRS